MRKISSRQAKRLMNQMGMKVESIDDVKQVIIKTSNENIIIDNPTVSVTFLSGESIYQIMGGTTKRSTFVDEKKKSIVIPEEDVYLVAQQAKTSLEEAKKALEMSNGDLAQAILILTQRK